MSKIYVGVTDYDWFHFLKGNLSLKPIKQGSLTKIAQGQEVDFWRSAASGEFKALEPGDLFLFKLRNNKNNSQLNGEIVGGAYFSRFEFHAGIAAWNLYGSRNGCASLQDFQKLTQVINSGKALEEGKQIGSIILENVFFFDPNNYISQPEDWKAATVQGKTYDTLESPVACQLEKDVMERI